MTKFISRLALGTGSVLAAGMLFFASPMQAGAVPLTSSPSGTANTDNGADEGNEATPEEGAGDTGEEQAAPADTGETSGGTVTSATVTVSSAKIRSDASTSSSVAGNATNGTELTVTGQTEASDGHTWYAVTFDSNGSTVTGYIRSDLVEAHESQPEPEPAPTETSEETTGTEEDSAASSDDYSVVYEDDGSGSGTSDWYLHDNTMGTKYKVSDLLNAETTNQNNQAQMDKATGTMRLVIIVMAAVILVLIVVVTVFIVRLRSAYDGYDDDDDDEDEDEEEEEAPRRRRFGR
ncbi:MAG: SH3 domain-containing protein, partial [Eubacteriales bacterium]|nr:SH3 domain-containing protein [Eubacteriales bacterium]